MGNIYYQPIDEGNIKKKQKSLLFYDEGFEIDLLEPNNMR